MSRLGGAACKRILNAGKKFYKGLTRAGYKERGRSGQQTLDAWLRAAVGQAAGVAESSTQSAQAQDKEEPSRCMPHKCCYVGRAVVPVDCNTAAGIVAYLEKLPREAIKDHEARGRQANSVYLVIFYSRSGQEVNMVEKICIKYLKETGNNGAAGGIPGAVCDNVANGSDSPMAYHKGVHTMHVVYYRLWTWQEGEWDDPTELCKWKKASADYENKTEEEKLAFVAKQQAATCPDHVSRYPDPEMLAAAAARVGQLVAPLYAVPTPASSPRKRHRDWWYSNSQKRTCA